MIFDIIGFLGFCGSLFRSGEGSSFVRFLFLFCVCFSCFFFWERLVLSFVSQHGQETSFWFVLSFSFLGWEFWVLFFCFVLFFMSFNLL